MEILLEFADLKISSVSIFNVEDLVIEPFAFRLMTKCPEQFVIKDSIVHHLPANSLAGLHNMTHLWFRNVTLHQVAGRSFVDVYNVQDCQNSKISTNSTFRPLPDSKKKLYWDLRKDPGGV